MKTRRFSQILNALIVLGALGASHHNARAQTPGAVPDAGIYASIEAVKGAQVPPLGLPVWGDARLDIPAHNFSVPAGARVIYVAPDGRENAQGTLVAPMSAQAALQAATPGSFVVFRGGLYRTGNLSLSTPATLQAYRDENPWFKGSIVVPYVAGEWKTETFEGRTLYYREKWAYDLGEKGPPHHIDGPVSKDGQREVDKSKNAHARRRNQVFLDGKMLREVDDLSWDYVDKESGQRVTGSRSAREQLLAPDADPRVPDARNPNGVSWTDAKEKRLYLSVNPAGHTLEAVVLEQGIYLGGSGPDAAITMRGLGFSHYGEEGAMVRNEGALIENCAFVSNGHQGLYAGGPTQRPTFRGNLFACNGNGGLRVHGAQNTLIEGNTMAWNNVKRFTLDIDSNGSKMTYTRDITVRHNRFENNYATGLWLDESVDRPLVYDNVASGNEGFGIFFEISKSCVIAYNVCQLNNQHGIAVSNSTDAQVWNNTLVRNGGAILVKYTGRKNTNKDEVADVPTGGIFPSGGNSFFNNLYMDYKPGKSGALFSARSTGIASTTMVKSSGHNAFVLTGTEKRPDASNWATVGGQNAQTPPLATLQAFRADPQNAGYEVGSLWLEGASWPFVSRERADVRPAPGAAIVGQGAPLPPAVAAIAKELGRPVNPPPTSARFSGDVLFSGRKPTP